MNATATAPVTADIWLEIVRRQATAMRFGTLEITIQEGLVTQVEATERKRLPADPRDSRRPAEASRP